MMGDLKASNNVISDDAFWTIVLPNFYRFPYLEKCIRSIEEQADMPYELIVHDDGSRDDSPQKIFEMQDKISTIVYNTGINMGLGRSADRCMQLAHSKYILFLNTDCILEKPCLKAIKDILDRPYVGVVTTAFTSNSNKVFQNNGTYFEIFNRMPPGYSFALRKDTWENSGGWDYEAFTGACDSAFTGRISQAGYFNAVWRDDGKRIVGNTGVNCTQEKSWVGSSTQYSDYDNAYPKLFNLPQGVTNEYISRQRHGICVTNIHAREKDPGGNVNLWYWHDFFQKMVPDGTTVDWKVAEKHPKFLKWKESIEQEQIYNL